MIRTKRVYEPKEPEDGLRLLVMRYWPRGVSKDQVDEWERELGTSKELIKEWKGERISWEEFRARYKDEIREKRGLVEKWAERARKEDITLLCGCEDPDRCHRTLLKEAMEEYLRTD